MRKNYIHECETIEQYCTYNAETHHILALKNEKLSIWFQLIPAVVAALSAFQSTGQLLPWTSPIWGWIAATAATITAVSTVLNPLKAYFDHFNAAKSFTVLKQDARALRETFSNGMDDQTFKVAVQNIHERYNDLIRVVPPTTKETFDEARKRIKAGVHKPD